MAAQLDLYLSALASAFDLRAWHFAILLSTALACDLGRGPCSVFAEGIEAFVFLFQEKRRSFNSCGLSQEIGDGMGWLHGCTAAQ